MKQSSFQPKPETNPNETAARQVFTYLKLSPDDNEYAHPLDVVPIVDLNSGEVCTSSSFL